MITNIEYLKTMASKYSVAAFNIVGNCMTGVNINNGDYVVVDFTRAPAPKDIVIAGRAMRSERQVYFMTKEYVKQKGDKHIVTTRPASGDDEELTVEYIFGVVIACTDSKGNVKWGEDKFKGVSIDLQRKAV